MIFSSVCALWIDRIKLDLLLEKHILLLIYPPTEVILTLGSGIATKFDIFFSVCPFEKTELNLTSGRKRSCYSHLSLIFTRTSGNWIKAKNHKWAEETNRAGWLVAGGMARGPDREDRGLGPSRHPDQCLPHKLELFWDGYTLGERDHLTLQLWKNIWCSADVESQPGRSVWSVLLWISHGLDGMGG